jgi:hypothetical protein
MSTVFRKLFQASTVKEGLNERGISQVSGREPRACDAGSCESDNAFHCFSTERNFPVGTLLKIYVKNILKIDSILHLICFYDQ